MTPSQTLLILGASGDLTERLLLPGLGSLVASEIPADRAVVEGLRIVGSGRSERSAVEWRATVRAAFEASGAFDGTKPQAALAREIVAQAEYVVADPTSKDDLARIVGDVQGGLVIYFALPPAVVTEVVKTLASVELPAATVFALEKPFGSDARSAAALNRHLLKLVSEEQIHRVDHFLGNSTVLNVLGLRLVNRLVEPIWNADNVERVEITYDEELGLEGRAGYYDSSGALVDMLQSHLLQVLAIVAMEPPARIDAVDFRAAAAQVLRSTAVWSGLPALRGTDAPSRRARYTAGTIGQKSLPAYVKEDGVDASRETETLAELVVGVNTRRWAGVPFVLRSGKAIGEPVKQIVLTLKPVGVRPPGLTGTVSPERIVIGMKPETISFELTMNGDGDPFSLESHALTTELEPSILTAYGEVMRGVLGGDPTLSIRGDVAEECWRIVSPVLNAWKKGDVPLESYRAGSQGPASWR